MKDNGFFELFNDIDSKFIDEAAPNGTGDREETYAEASVPQIAPKRKIYPAILKTAACLAVIGAAAGALIVFGKGAPDSVLSPNSHDLSGGKSAEISNIFDTSAEITDISVITEPPASDLTETPIESLDVTDIVFPALQTPSIQTDNESDTENPDENAEKEAAIKEWNGLEHVTPLDDMSLSEEYSPIIDPNGTDTPYFFLKSGVPNDDVKAISDGEIIHIERNDGTNGYKFRTDNNHVIVKYNDYIYIDYRYVMAKEELKKGDRIAAGQVIGNIDGEINVYRQKDSDEALTESEVSGSSDYKCDHGFYIEIITDYLLEDRVDDIYDRSGLAELYSPLTDSPVTLASTDIIGSVLKEINSHEIQFGASGYEYVDFTGTGMTSTVSERYASVFIPAEYGSEVFALFDGTVTKAEFETYFGYCVRVECDGQTILYTHLSEMKVEAGDKISKDQVVGCAGTTGHAYASGGGYVLYKEGME